MIVEIEIMTLIKYLNYAKEYLDKIKLPYTDNKERDILNSASLILAKANLDGVMQNLKEDRDKRKKELDEMDEIFREEKI